MKKYQVVIWLAAMVLGIGIGLLGIDGIDKVMSFIATVFTRLFRLLAVPTIVLAVITTLASLGGGREVGRMFRATVTYTLLTTVAAAAVGLFYYIIVSPGNLPLNVINEENPGGVGKTEFTYSDHLMSVIPDNIVKPLLDGNVLALLLICFAVGIAISKMPDSKPKHTLLSGLTALQEVLFIMIRWLITILPIGIMAFAAQLVSEVGGNMMLDSLGKYILVILAGNCTQFIVILPLFLLLSGLNPIRTLKGMAPAVMMAFFTKSSAATLPVTMENAEKNLDISPKVSRFVLPICTTVNMNGCAAFILVTSLFVMQNNAIPITWVTMSTWLLIAVISAVGNAGVPMGCYFLTLSLMSGIGANVTLMGIILPVYTIIDMVETAENVWSDSCVCAITDKRLC